MDKEKGVPSKEIKQDAGRVFKNDDVSATSVNLRNKEYIKRAVDHAFSYLDESQSE